MINLKKIPSMDEILMQEEIQGLMERYKRDYVVDTARTAVAEIRAILRNMNSEIEQSIDEYLEELDKNDEAEGEPKAISKEELEEKIELLKQRQKEYYKHPEEMEKEP
jgi:anion-transporting  ArsA/GET3 family ATPase